MAPSPPGRPAFAALALLASTAFTLMAVELGVRARAPVPRAQVVRPPLRLVDGVPVWEAEGSAARQNEGCVPRGGARWLVLGSSILFGSGLDAEDSPPLRLQAALPPGSCVHGFAQPASTFEGQAAAAWEALARLAPGRALWEVWDNSPLGFTVVGGTAYNLHGLATGPDGLPRVPGAPARLNRWLLPRSRAWEVLALNLAPEARVDMGAVWRHFTRQHLRPALLRLREAGVEPALYLAPRLDRPFDAPRDDPYAPVEALAAELGVQALRGERLLAGQDAEALRLDPCCHLNAAGVEALSRALAEALAPAPP